MSAVAIDIEGFLDAALSHTGATGHFERLNGHEPQNAPVGGGLTGAAWVDRLVPIPRGSGLDSVTAVLVLNVRIYASAVSEPVDAIDPDMVKAADAVVRAFIGDFTFGGALRNIDIFGAHGQALDVRAGYLTQDGMPLRVLTIWLPCVVNDLWEEAA